MINLEEAIREQLRPTYPNVDSMWFSSVKVSSQCPPTLRAKIWVSGRAPCKFVDEQGNSIPIPEDWNGLCCLPIFSVQAYVQKSCAGLILECVALMVGGKRQPNKESCLTFV